MPTVSRFFGILIRMYADEHGIPHFHAKHAEDEAVFEIETLDIIEGELSSRDEALVKAWAILHTKEIWENFRRLQKGLEVKPIAPLRK